MDSVGVRSGAEEESEGVFKERDKHRDTYKDRERQTGRDRHKDKKQQQTKTTKPKKTIITTKSKQSKAETKRDRQTVKQARRQR